jgi:hypothetical protein
MQPDTVAQPGLAGRWRMIFLPAIMICLIAWWPGSDDDAPVAMSGAGPSTPAAPAAPAPMSTQGTRTWGTEVAKDPFGVRGWPRDSAQERVPPAVSARPVATARAAAVPAVVRSVPLRAAPSRPAAAGDDAPGIGQEAAPEQPPE